MKNKKYLYITGLILIIIIGTAIYFMTRPKFEDYSKLHKELPKKQIMTKAQVSKIDQIKGNPITIGDKRYNNGWLYTYIFDANNKKYMGNYFSKKKTYSINDSITIIYLPDNPKINEHKK